MLQQKTVRIVAHTAPKDCLNRGAYGTKNCLSHGTCDIKDCPPQTLRASGGQVSHRAPANRFYLSGVSRQSASSRFTQSHSRSLLSFAIRTTSSCVCFSFAIPVAMFVMHAIPSTFIPR